jgi:hypothetical protein
MAGLAKLQHNTSNPPTRSKLERIPRKIRQAVELLLSGECKTQKAAAARANITPEHLCKMLKKPATQSFVREKTAAALANGQMPAARRLVELVDAESESVAIQASVQVLKTQGHFPQEGASVNVGIGVNVGYIVDWRSARQEIEQQTQGEPNHLIPMVDVTPKGGTTP